MTDKILPFPTEEYIDKLSVDKLVGDLAALAKDGGIANLMVVRFDKNGDAYVVETGGLTLGQMSYGIALLQHHLSKWLDK